MHFFNKSDIVSGVTKYNGSTQYNLCPYSVLIKYTEHNTYSTYLIRNVVEREK